MSAIHDTASLVENYAYQVHGVTYLPHYRNESLFVGPGYPRQSNHVYTAEDLTKAGANRITLMLWSRGKVGVVNHINR